MNIVARGRNSFAGKECKCFGPRRIVDTLRIETRSMTLGWQKSRNLSSLGAIGRGGFVAQTGLFPEREVTQWSSVIRSLVIRNWLMIVDWWLLICEVGRRIDKPVDLEDRLVDFAVRIINVIEAVPSSKAGNHVAGQLIRSGTAPAPNYGEARSGESRKDFIHKMKIGLKELNESRVWLKIITRSEMLPEAKLRNINQECDELWRIVNASVKTTQKKLWLVSQRQVACWVENLF